MVILSDTDPTDFTVIASFRKGHLTIEAISFDWPLIACYEQLCQIFPLWIRVGSLQKAQIEEDKDTKQNSLSNLAVKISKLNDHIQDSHIGAESYQKYDGYGTISSFGLVLYLDVAVKFDKIQASEFLIEHLGDSLVLVLDCDFNREGIGMIFYVPVCPLDEKLADYPCIAVAHSHHERSISLIIRGIQGGQLWTSQEISYNILTIHIAGPVQGSALV